MKLARRCLVLVLLFALAQFAPAAQAQARRKSEASKPKPDLADFKYGPHERNVLDLWKAKSDKPTPLVVLHPWRRFSRRQQRSAFSCPARRRAGERSVCHGHQV